jgi:hypothetical protein
MKERSKLTKYLFLNDSVPFAGPAVYFFLAGRMRFPMIEIRSEGGKRE